MIFEQNLDIIHILRKTLDVWSTIMSTFSYVSLLLFYVYKVNKFWVIIYLRVLLDCM